MDGLSVSTSILSRGRQETPDVPRRLALLREAGFRQIELTCKFAAQGAAPVRESGLKVWSIHGIAGGEFRSESGRRKIIDLSLAYLEPLAEFAPCPVVEHYLDRFHDPSFGVGYRKLIEGLYRRYHEFGFILCVETAPYKPLENERYPYSSEIADFVRSFRQDDLLMTIDVNHSNLHEDLAEVCANCRGLIRNVHVSDNHGGYEDHLAPGEGIIDLPAAFAALRRNGYNGPCNLECRLPANAPSELDGLRTLREYVAGLLFPTPGESGADHV